MPSYKRVAVVMKAFIGDAVMATPLLEGLRKQVDTVVVAPPLIGDVLGPDWSDTLIPIHGRGFLPQVRALRQARADLALVLNRSFRSALSAKAAGIPNRVGLDAERRGFLLTHRVPLDWEQHETLSYLSLAAAVGYELDPANPHLQLSNEERAKGKELLAGADLALQPGARHEYKRLATQTLAELTTKLVVKGYRPVLVGGSDEQGAAEALLELLPGIPSLVGKCSLRETLGVLGGVRMTVGSDTGVMHLAAAVGSPTVTVFEPSQPSSRWGHLYPPHQVVEAPPSGIANVSVESIVAAVEAARPLTR